jgi:hypothetical protein
MALDSVQNILVAFVASGMPQCHTILMIDVVHLLAQVGAMVSLVTMSGHGQPGPAWPETVGPGPENVGPTAEPGLGSPKSAFNDGSQPAARQAFRAFGWAWA